MENVKSIEYYPNGNIKRMEFFRPVQFSQLPQPRIDWSFVPCITAAGSASMPSSYGGTSLLSRLIDSWNTPEEQWAWSGL